MSPSTSLAGLGFLPVSVLELVHELWLVLAELLVVKGDGVLGKSAVYLLQRASLTGEAPVWKVEGAEVLC